MSDPELEPSFLALRLRTLSPHVARLGFHEVVRAMGDAAAVLEHLKALHAALAAREKRLTAELIAARATLASVEGKERTPTHG